MDLEQRVRELCLLRKATIRRTNASAILGIALKRLCVDFEIEYGLYEQPEDVQDWLTD